MPLVPGRELLAEARRGGYAVGAFNFNNLEFLQAIVGAAGDAGRPVFLATSEGAISYAGLESVVALVRAAAAATPVPLCLHLDHGKNLDVIRRCIEFGYTSVMIDASDLPFEENVAKTRAVVELARPRGVSVEAELGRLVGVEDEVSVAERDAVLVDPEQAGEFVRLTGIDSLAPAVGTSHGAFKFKGEPKLDFDRLRLVAERTGGLPLVLHGASSVPDEVLARCRDAGVEVPGARGVPQDQLLEAIRLGVAKVNVDTDLRLEFVAGVRSALNEHPSRFDPREYLGPARDAVRALVGKRIRLLSNVK
ncbi:class II fructose-1,6-bisphosphate aldolase [candidate division WOR-3 bacterium]|nr:class II fructose-1,6-bisphosphate aldolase [candidate division WOR-3 bacterium]